MNIGITGGTGFIGRHLIRELERRKIPYGLLDRKTNSLFKPNTLKEFVVSKDVIVHLAGVNVGSNNEAVRVNVSGTLGLLEAMVKFSPYAKIIFSSSFQTYVKDSIFGLSKGFAEKLIRYYSDKHLLKSTILRITNVYGPGCKPFYNSVIATFTHQIHNDKQIIINGSGNQRRDYLYITDLIDAIIKTIEYKQNMQSEYIDICSGKQISLRELMVLFRKICKKEINVRYADKKREDFWNIPNNYDKAKQLLGWKPKIDIEEGLTNIMNSLK